MSERKTHRPYLGAGYDNGWLSIENMFVSQPAGYWEKIPSICSITGAQRYMTKATAKRMAGKAVMTFDWDYTVMTVVHKVPEDGKWFWVNYVVSKKWWEEEKRIQRETRLNHGVYNGKPNPYSIR